MGEAQTKTVSIYFIRCRFGFPNLIDDSIPNDKGAALVVELLPLSFYTDDKVVCHSKPT